MASPVALVTHSGNQNGNADTSGSTLPSNGKHENGGNSHRARRLYRYHDTKMVSNLADVTAFADPLDVANRFNSETLFHYCNLILDQFDKEVQVLALFRDDLNYGPKDKPVDIFFHPFEWKDQWHLAIGFVKYDKILLVHCSNYTLAENEEGIRSYPSFTGKTSIRIQDFVIHFNQKLSKNSLKFPRLYTDMFKPATASNAINLLTIIFAFCLDPISLTRSFCDPLFSPTKFDISDFHPIIAKLDPGFREEQQREYEVRRKQKLELLRKMKRREKKEKEERERQEFEAEVKERQRMAQERINLEKEDRERRAREREERQQQNDSVHKVGTKAGSDFGDSVKREQDDIKEPETIVKRQKTRSRLGKTISAPIEINDLEDSDDVSEEEERLPIKTQELAGKGIGDILKEMFLPNYAIEFKKYILHSELFANSDKIDLMFDFIRQFSYDPLLNTLLHQNGPANRIPKNLFDIRKSLIVTYKRRMKQEFDESKFEQIMETDSLNQVIPLIFENGSIFLINIKTSDKFNCIVKLICITNRTNRSEREILRNYAFRRLVEMHVAKYNRLVIKIRTSIITIKRPEFYKVAMASFCVLQRMLWKNKFELTYKPKLETLESYNVYFQKMMEGVETADVLATELNLKRIVKYSLID